LHFLGSDRTINSIVLLSNGISFAIQIVLFLILGSYADFGTFRSPILLGLSIAGYAIGFAWLGVHNPDQWQIGTGLYIAGLLAYQVMMNLHPSWARKNLIPLSSVYRFGVLAFRCWLETRENFERRQKNARKVQSHKKTMITRIA
jgi:hypothetical protein